MSGVPNWMFRALSPEEEAEFRAWARENFQPWSKINETWHPVVRDECEKINEETEAKLAIKSLCNPTENAVSRGVREAIRQSQEFNEMFCEDHPLRLKLKEENGD